MHFLLFETSVTTALLSGLIYWRLILAPSLPHLGNEIFLLSNLPMSKLALTVFALLLCIAVVSAFTVGRPSKQQRGSHKIGRRGRKQWKSRRPQRNEQREYLGSHRPDPQSWPLPIAPQQRNRGGTFGDNGYDVPEIENEEQQEQQPPRQRPSRRDTFGRW